MKKIPDAAKLWVLRQTKASHERERERDRERERERERSKQGFQYIIK